MNLDAIKKLIEAIQIQIAILRGEVRKTISNQPRTIPSLPDPEYIIIHHGGGDWPFEKVNNHHRDLWGFKSSLGYFIGYQYWIEYNGKIYNARRDNEEAAHTVDPARPNYYNQRAIGIGLRGNMDIENPTPTQLLSLFGLIEEKRKKYHIPNTKILGHREVSKTNCPGQNLFKWSIQNYPN